MSAQPTLNDIYSGLLPQLKAFNAELLENILKAIRLPRKEAIPLMRHLGSTALGAMKSQPGELGHAYKTGMD